MNAGIEGLVERSLLGKRVCDISTILRKRAVFPDWLRP
jgi:hypothetical protein